MTQLKALIIDDEPDICELLELTLQRMDIDTESAGTVAAAKRLIDSNQYHLCLTDMRLPDGNGIELVKLMQLKYPDVPVAVITAHGNMDTAVEAMKAGAFDFVSKPVDLSALRKLVSAAPLTFDWQFQSDSKSGNQHSQTGALPGAGVHRWGIRQR
jgi:two-component system response regulator PilR (NtrC family)